MSVRRAASMALALALAALPAAADKLDKESKNWLEQVGPILLPEERQIYTEQIQGRGERAEFEKIFWARRDPNLETPENEYQPQFQARKADADKRFKVAGKAGSQTDCGRLLILLGEPDEIKKDPVGENPGFRAPETWTFKSRPGMSFAGGQAKISLDPECKLANAAAGKELDRIAGGLILNPNLVYKVTGGKLTRLQDLLPKPSPAQALLKTPRQDFAIQSQLGFMKAAEGGYSVLLGVVRADAANLSVEEQGGKKVARVTVIGGAAAADGHMVASEERSVIAPVDSDGSVQAAYRVFLKPGQYTLKYGLVDDKSGKAALASEPSAVPDLNSGELSVGTLWILSDIVELAGEADAKEALGAFTLGKTKLVPRFGNVFLSSESPLFFYNVSDGAVDPATGTPKVSVSLTLTTGTRKVAEAPAQEFTDALVVSAVGPVPLQKYDAGTYVATLKVKDLVAKTEKSVEGKFEIKK